MRDADEQAALSGASRRRRLFLWLATAAFLLLVLAIAALSLRRLDAARLVAERATAALGRQVAFGSLRVVPGVWIGIDATDARLANPPGAAQPDMLRVGRLHAEVAALSLLVGPPRFRHISVANATLRLEPAGRFWNWRFPGRNAGSVGGAAMPLIEDLKASNFDILYIMRGGMTLRTHLEWARIAAGGGHIGVEAAGAYNALPVSLTADLHSAAPFTISGKVPVRAQAHSGSATLDFDGTATDPLNVDGLDGKISVAAQHTASLPGLAAGGLPDFPLQVGGTLRRQGNHWVVSEAAGTVAGVGFTAPKLAFDEGTRGAPDAIAADLRLDRLDAAGLPAARGGGAGTDLALAIDPHPDPLIDLRLTTPELVYGKLRFTDLRLAASRVPGRIAVNDLALSWLGAAVRASGRIEPAGAEGRLSLSAALRGADIETFRRFLGFGAVPISGALNGRAAIVAQGSTLNAAAGAARITAVASMPQGRIARRLVRLAATDLRLLVRAAPGTTPITCLLAVAELRGGAGMISPFRIGTAEGTLAGRGSFDLRRQSFDLVLGSERASTNFWALDVPMRASGSFADPRIVPARLSAQGRADLARLNTLPQLPPDLLADARANRCFRAAAAAPASAPPARPRPAAPRHPAKRGTAYK